MYRRCDELFNGSAKETIASARKITQNNGIYTVLCLQFKRESVRHNFVTLRMNATTLDKRPHQRLPQMPRQRYHGSFPQKKVRHFPARGKTTGFPQKKVRRFEGCRRHLCDPVVVGPPDKRRVCITGVVGPPDKRRVCITGGGFRRPEPPNETLTD